MLFLKRFFFGFGCAAAASPELDGEAAAGEVDAAGLCLKELLELHRQRLEQSKQHFLLSTPPTPTSCGSISLCVSLTPSLTVGTSSSLLGGEPEQDQQEEEEDEQQEDEEEEGNQDDEDELQCNTATEVDSGMQVTTPTITVSSNAPLQKSPSTNSSLHLLYTSLFRKLAHGQRGRQRRRRGDGSQSEQEEYDVDVDDVDGGVCDISGGELSDEYDHCDVSLRKRCTRRVARDVSETDYHGDVELETAPTRESCYETSDTGGELTNTDDLDSSMNLISNLSYNSSNSNTSNTSGQQRRTAAAQSSTATGATAKGTATAPTASTGQALSVLAGRNPKTAALPKAKPKPKTILSAPKQHTHKGGSVSSPNSSDCSSASPAGIVPVSPVGRSKSFQEPGVARYKKYGRGLFQRRRSKRSPKGAAAGGGGGGGTKSNYSLDRLSQNIEITIQDEDGVIQPYDDNYHTLPSLSRLPLDATDADAYDDVEYEDLYLDDRPQHHRLSGDDIAGDISDGGASSRSRVSDADATAQGHVLGRLLRRVRGLSAGWRKPRYQKRRGD